MLPDYWTQTKELLEPLYEQAGYDENHMVMSLLGKKMQLWCGDSFACITQINVYPKWKVATVLFIGGDKMADWIDEFNPILCDWAKGEGCRFMEAHGRMGWKRVLNRFNAKTVAMTVRKELDG